MYNQKNNYLIHWGIKGQKWGIRRFQNADGSLTEEGRRRYGVYNDLVGRSTVTNKKIQANNRSTFKNNLSELKNTSKNGIRNTIKTINKNNRENNIQNESLLKNHYSNIKKDIGTKKLVKSAALNLALSAGTKIATNTLVNNIDDDSISFGATIVGNLLSGALAAMSEAEFVNALFGEAYSRT